MTKTHENVPPNRRGPWIALAVAGGLIAVVGLAVITWRLSGNAAEPPKPVAAWTPYVSDFANNAGGWTPARTDRTPKGGKPFLGPYGMEKVSLKLDNLPPHRFVRVRADLYLVRSWDGPTRLDINRSVSGPDFFSLRLADGPTLLRAAFGGTPDDRGFGTLGKLQTYPAPIPSRPSGLGVGGGETNTLGFVAEFHRGQIKFDMDVRHPLDLIVPHTDGAIELVAEATGLQSIGDESWGLADVRIDALDAAGETWPAKQLEEWFAAVAGDEPTAARDAFWNLVSGGDATVEFLRGQSVPPGFNLADVVARAGAFAGDDEGARADAMLDLAAMGPGVEAVLIAGAAGAEHALSPADTNLILEMIELRPIEGQRARRAAAKARLLTTIDTPAARVALRDWLAAGPAWRPDDLRKFESAYRLPEGVALAYLPKPDPAVRRAYLTRRAALLGGVPLQQTRNFAQPSPDASQSLAFDLAEPAPNLYTPIDVITPDAAAPEDGTSVVPLDRLMHAMQRAQSSKGRKTWVPVEVPPALQRTPLPGDWLIRHYAPQDQLLADLVDILSQQTGKKVRFERDTAEKLVRILIDP